MSSRAKIIEQMLQAGLAGLQESDLRVDGQLHRFRPEGEKTPVGWYCLFEHRTEDGRYLIGGKFGSWKWASGGITVSWRGAGISRADRERLAQETRAHNEQAQKVQRARRRRAAHTAQRVWHKLPTTGQSEYLKRKQIKGYGVRYHPTEDALYLPLSDMLGDVYGLQIIRSDPSEQQLDKEFWPAGTSPKNRFFRLGGEPLNNDPLVICEGYATGASVHEATGYTVFVAWNAGNLCAVAQIVRGHYPQQSILMAADDDYLTKKPNGAPWNPGREAGEKAAAAVGGLMLWPRFEARPEAAKWTDFNDLHCAEGLPAVRAQFSAAAASPLLVGWRKQLTHTSTGMIRAVPANLDIIMRNDPELVGAVGYCRFSDRVYRRRALPFAHDLAEAEWSDHDSVGLQVWLERHYKFTPRISDVEGVVDFIARSFSFNPIVEFLSVLDWDSIPRLDYWLSDAFGLDCTEYIQLVSRKFLIGMVARAFEPGCKLDSVPILEGQQGLLKSTAFSILGGQWFSDTPFPMGDKEGYLQNNGVWLHELAELDALNKVEATRSKAFITSSKDRYRVPYGRRARDFYRSTVYVGTTNKMTYLKDPTGGRRFWPIAIQNPCDTVYLKTAREQLFAEAVVAYRAGEPWWVLENEEPLFTAVQASRLEESAWETFVEDYLEAKAPQDGFTLAEIFMDCLAFKPSQIQKVHENKLAEILQDRLGWQRRRKRGGGARQWRYYRPTEAQPK